jgi:hypothetical protein
MLTVAGGIILAIVLIAVFIGLFFLMLSGFQTSRTLGCLTMMFFGSLALILAMCVFG